jgi:SAM-dependent methyltransferase
MLHVEGALAIALQRRGINVHAVICDGAYRACILRENKDRIPIVNWKNRCLGCKAENSAVLNRLGIPYSFIGDFVPKLRRDELWKLASSATWENLDNLQHRDLPLDKNVRSAVLRYLQGYNEPENNEVVREYTFSALVCAEAALCSIQSIMPFRVFMSHAIYVDWGPALQAAFALGIPITAWMGSYLLACFYFRHLEDNRNIDFHNISHKAWEDCKRMQLSFFQDSRLNKFLEDRYKKNISFDMKIFKGYAGDSNNLRQKYTAVSTNPLWGILAHINWDQVSDYSSMAYSSFNEWMIETIRTIINISDIQWLIKIHPAESWYPPASGVQALINDHFPVLPPHVKVISAEEEISPFDFYQMVDGGVTVYGTAGLEMALLGKPIILAGEAHYGGKGFTYDGLTPETYKQLLKQTVSLKPLTQEQILLAKKYAYCYFIQRQIPFPVVHDPKSQWWNLQWDKLNSLLPGKDPFVDFICEKILDGKDFIMDEELVALAQREEKAITTTLHLSDNIEKTAVDQPITKILGFDPLGEVFSFDNKVLRGIFPGKGESCKNIFDAYLKNNLSQYGIIQTKVFNDDTFDSCGYDMIFEHDKIPFITYSHEWTSEMLKDAALFQLDLSLKLLQHDLVLKDCGASGNVLFKATQPFFVDFLSLTLTDELTKEEFLKPSALHTPFQDLWSKQSSFFNEIFCRMFYPYFLYPLYMMHKRQHQEARKRIFETTLNTRFDVISENETFDGANKNLLLGYHSALAAREHSLITDNWHQFLNILKQEIEPLPVSIFSSNYSGYYEQKREDFPFEPSPDWLPKQHIVYNAIRQLCPKTVFDIGANTGWFSLLAAKLGCDVVSIDNDEACMNILYMRAKQDKLPILPLVMDFAHPTPDVKPFPGYEKDPHTIQSKIQGEVPLLLSADKRLKCDMVLALAIVHHLCLGQGMNLESAVNLLVSFSEKSLVVEFVAKEDPLVVGEPEFFTAFNKNPSQFEWYSQKNLIEELNKHYSQIEMKDSTKGRKMFICSGKIKK